MENKARVSGHPIHPMLIAFPVGLFFTAVVCDVIYLINQDVLFPVVAYYDIAGGLLGGLVAAIFGMADSIGLPGESRAKRLSMTHGAGNIVMLALFLASWLLRRNATNFAPSDIALACSLIGLVLEVYLAWLGNEMVFRLGVGSTPAASPSASEPRADQSTPK